MDVQKKYGLKQFLMSNGHIGKPVWMKLLLGFGVTLFFTFLFPGSDAVNEPGHEGTVWTEGTLYAPFAFPIYKDQHEYETERSTALTGVKPVVERLPETMSVAMETLTTRVVTLKAAADSYRKWKNSHAAADSLQYIRISYPLNLPVVNWDSIARIAAGPIAPGKEKLPAGFALILSQVRAHVEDIYNAGILDSGGLKRQTPFLALRKGALEEPLATQGLRSLGEAQMELRTRLGDHFGEGSTLAKLAFALGEGALAPNIRFDAVQTAREAQAALENVPRTLGYVQDGERIAGKNERITPEIKSKLDSYFRAKADRGTDEDARTQRLGAFFHVLLVFSLYATYLFLFRKKIFGNIKHLTAIALIFVFVGVVAYLSRIVNVNFPAQYLILVPVGSMLLTMLFDSRVAFYGTVTVALLVGGIRGNDYSIMVASLIAGTLGAYTVRDIKSRTQIFRSLGFIFLGYAVAIIALGLERYEDSQTIIIELALGFANAFISSLLAYAILIILEKFFGITTDLQLLELADFNHPLLQRLSEEAPGTFHHSVTLGNLAEAAADDIGANSILAKVGAYYHDVGKLVKPEYFVENQVGQPNRHVKLKPRMSAKIIIAHVTEGMELARQYGIPEKVIDFIPQHHGTTTISFFFDKALRQAAARKNNKEIISKDDYRYPGPKPQTREAAIVMLADTVEATTRSVTEITAQKLEATIDGMIKQRYVEGELDDCELTMRDLTKIREAFLQILIGIHHHRIQYPQAMPEPEIVLPGTQVDPTVQDGGDGSTSPEPQSDTTESQPANVMPAVSRTTPRRGSRQPQGTIPSSGEYPVVPESAGEHFVADPVLLRPTTQGASDSEPVPPQHHVDSAQEQPNGAAYDTFGESKTTGDGTSQSSGEDRSPVAGSFTTDASFSSDTPVRPDEEPPEYIP